ncbi:BMP family ABC transporter substrate-binding protein [Herbiconiux sp. CPCC 205716]|uniref:BMP family ABC transporter substrate-binding protein n=1 Tax=Herbiconiux gentiana TaxID=2970912 RepID=A0ABT2GJA2_9MICO|nr:BMP family ABC transporter substrate-binding protein [Herbiconiux gentiana]MCS5716305.1 BMP family ABC transporter substrate-binding protein [Herbiconiux gentiana]
MTRSTPFPRLGALGALTATAALVLAGCASAPSDAGSASGTSPAGAEGDVLPCIVSDEGGFDDQSFNQLGLEGVTLAAKALGTDHIDVQSESESDYAPNIASLVDQGCTTIVTMGYLLAAATEEAATANPDVHFVMVDDNTITADNVKAAVWDTSQAGFLVGYAAADYTATGKVGTYGGAQIPPVTLYMDGFARGVEYHNAEKGTDVQVIGWNPDTQEGQFTGNFSDINAAKVLSQGILEQGVDVILPVGGPIYKGAGQAIRESAKPVALVGVDTDMYVSDPDYDDLWFSSIARDMPKSISEVIQASASGDFSNETYVGTLENGGVLMSPFHDFTSKVAPTLQAELDTIEQGLVAGTIPIDTPSAP